MRKEHNKLVRDKIPEIIGKSQKQYKQTILSKTEFVAALKNKIIEEAQEASKAENSTELIQEIADLYEVIDTLLTIKGIKSEEVLKVKREKKQEKGGFEKRIKLIWTEE
ncbi:MAG: nucleoside triphosphate pyrophosphohydrolase [Prochloraceae cyanobacterium]|nr:nucleoside triphosphate pyrophosphohydrolase [Prochloraceae cyanobacterium]